MFRIKLSPDRSLFIRDNHNNMWVCWSPNGEYWEDESGDELSDDAVADWPEVVISDNQPDRDIVAEEQEALAAEEERVRRLIEEQKAKE